MTDEEAQAIAARAEAATPGTWEVWEIHGRYPPRIRTTSPLVRHTVFGWVPEYSDWYEHRHEAITDAAFIAHARTDIPMLLAERAALLKIVRGVAVVSDSAFDAVCPFCYGSDARHTADCPIDQARAQFAGSE